jgi:hypothetical protein
LLQTDLDGTSTTSSVVSVLRRMGSGRPLVVYTAGDQLNALHAFPAGSRFELMDMMGRLVASGSTVIDERTQLPISGLQPGAYVFRISNGDRVESTRIVL